MRSVGGCTLRIASLFYWMDGLLLCLQLVWDIQQTPGKTCTSTVWVILHTLGSFEKLLPDLTNALLFTSRNQDIVYEAHYSGKFWQYLIHGVCWKIAGADATPSGNLFMRYSPLCVLITRNFFDSSSNSICMYASERSGLVKCKPPLSAVNSSSDRGRGYWLMSKLGFIVTL